eukprot:GEMP01069783.1.p1 GENE.GEMP01069783.1~~GEMP01069783.1.p1  ORF type:complete len:185 (+),score=60.82 GEMP01069783.1:641-1195(+)
MDDVEHLQALVDKLRRELEESRRYAQKNKDLFDKAKCKIRQLLEKIRQRDAAISTLKSRQSLEVRENVNNSIRDQIQSKLKMLLATNTELEMDIDKKERVLKHVTNEESKQEITREILCKKEFLVQQKQKYTELAAKAKVDFDTKSSDSSEENGLWEMDWSQISPSHGPSVNDFYNPVNDLDVV